MKVLITGGSGLLGSAVSFCFKDYFDVVATYTSHPISIDGCKTLHLDITDVQDTMTKLKEISPDVIIHTAALVGVGICEKEPELAYKVNVDGTKNIVDAAQATNSKIIYISTDYVFDGTKGMYKEDDQPNPINYYGKTKLEGEKLIDVNNNTIIRTSIYGWNIVKEKKSFSSWIINELGNNRQINLFTDQFNSMILVNNCAEALKEIVDCNINGIMNIASSERFSKYDYALKLAEIFEFDSGLINPVKNKDIPGHEKRPIDVSLDTSKAQKKLKTLLLSVENSLLKLKDLKNEGYLDNFRVV